MFSANSSQVSEDRLYVEDVFSTYLYTGNGGTQTITNGIDLAGKGGLVWIKSRSAAYSNVLFDTIRGAGYKLQTDATNAQSYNSNSLTAFNSNGFGVGGGAWTGISPDPYASWTFREAPKFFDVVTYTGNGASNRSISHALGVAPGVMIIKRYDSTGQWVTYHRSLGNGNALVLESTSAQFATNTFGYTTPDATTFTVNDYNNINGATYVAYLFAHDTTSDGIIQCGSYTGNGSATGPTVTLGWEPQWVLVKNTTTAGYDWWMLDTMRGFTAPSANDAYLVPNLSQAEANQEIMTPTATGFQLATLGPMFNKSGDTFIYIAIRRGPMRTPTTGTSVFAPVARTGTSAGASVSSGFTTDLAFIKTRNSVENWDWEDRLRGSARYISSNATSAEAYAGTYPGGTIYFDTNNGVNLGADSWVNGASTYVNYFFRRAPSFFDVVCYTGTGVAGQTISHNLGVAPELIITKKRNAASTLGWAVGTTFAASTSDQLFLNTTDAASQTTYNGFITSKPTATAFNVSAYTDVGASAQTYVAYLFASCPGVSKVGTYTGNGSSQTINCGFAAGARFVMIKRASAAGDWYVWDSARGIVSGNDPRLSLNTTAAEVTTDDSVDTDSSGFVVNQLSATNINVSSATYLYMAVA
jgi:hypothetical protein